jgi:hypothetical protein
MPVKALAGSLAALIWHVTEASGRSVGGAVGGAVRRLTEQGLSVLMMTQSSAIIACPTIAALC